MSSIVPAVLPKSAEDFDTTLQLYASLAITRVQIDVVDGIFAAPASWPFTAPKELRDRILENRMLPYLERIEYEIDLMCYNALQIAAGWLALGANRLTFHAESITSLPTFLKSARQQFGHIVSFGLAINIASDLSLLGQSLDEIAYIQFMGIAEIGKQGQPFDSRVLEKIRRFSAAHQHIPIQVDGGVSLDSAAKLLALNVRNLVVGSSLLRSNNPRATLSSFEALRSPYHNDLSHFPVLPEF